MITYQTFIYEVTDGVATIRLNDPDRLNALTFETYAELERVFAERVRATPTTATPRSISAS